MYIYIYVYVRIYIYICISAYMYTCTSIGSTPMMLAAARGDEMIHVMRHDMI